MKLHQAMQHNKNAATRFTESDIREIRSLYPGMMPTQIARRYGAPVPTIKGILYGNTWTHVL